MYRKSPDYPWQRYLCPIDDSYERTDDGLLVEPVTTGVWRRNEHLRPIEVLAENNCLVILGEPGIGKSSILKDFAQWQRSVKGHDDFVVKASFADFAIGGDLRTELFDDSDFQQWRAGTGTMHLFLDGLDEAHIPIDALMPALKRNLKRQPENRLFLRITCRATAWPREYNGELASIWNKESLPIFRVTVLSQSDVQLAGAESGIDAQSFFQWLRTHGVQPLAAIPLTLELLLRQFAHDKSTSINRHILYERGSHDLCLEWNPKHERSQRKPITTADQRVLVAGRIAALGLLAGRDSINCNIDVLTHRATDLTFQEISGYSESTNGNSFQVNREVIQEALNTGLFVQQAGDRYTWIHRTFQEYLAAVYLTYHISSTTELLALFDSPAEPNGRFPAQFQEVIGWLSVLSSDIKDAVIQRDPVALLRSDSAALPDEDRMRIVEWLLHSVKQGTYFPRFDEYRLYQKLNHPRLAEQIVPVLTDCSASRETRRVAIELAEENLLHSVQSVLVRLVLDNDAPVATRIDAANAIAEIGDSATRAQLRPLLNDNVPNDVHQQLHGIVLKLLWPEHLSADEFFSLLVTRNHNRILDRYAIFLENEFAESLRVDDLPVALDWVRRNSNEMNDDNEAENLADAIIYQALLHLNEPSVRDPLVSTLRVRLEHHKRIPTSAQPRLAGQSTQQMDEGQRRLLFTLLLKEFAKTEKDIWLLTLSRTSLVYSKDVPWLTAELYPQLTDAAQQEALATIIHRMWYYEDVEQSTVIYEAVQRYETLAKELGNVFNAIDLDSDLAMELKESHQHREKLKQQDAARAMRRYEPKIDLRLAEVEANPSTWWILDLELLVDEHGHIHESRFDILKTPGWLASNESIRQRIVLSAISYLNQGDPSDDEWVGKANYIYHPARSGYRALYLLQQIGILTSIPLSSETLAKWALSVITAKQWTGGASDETDLAVLTFIAKQAPESFVSAGIKALHHASSHFDVDQLATRLSNAWHPAFTDELWRQLVQHVDELDYMRILLPSLLEFDPVNAKVYAIENLPNPNTEFDPADEKALIAARSLLLNTPDLGWSTLWHFIQSIPEFGKRLLLETADALGFQRQSIADKLDVQELANLLEWLIQQFPFAEDPSMSDTGFSSRHEVANLRNSILNNLVEQGTHEATSAFKEIITRNPEIPQAQQHLFTAQERLRQGSWQPIDPQQWLRLIHSTEGKATFDQREQAVGQQFNAGRDVNIYLIDNGHNGDRSD